MEVEIKKEVRRLNSQQNLLAVPTDSPSPAEPAPLMETFSPLYSLASWVHF